MNTQEFIMQSSGETDKQAKYLRMATLFAEICIFSYLAMVWGIRADSPTHLRIPKRPAQIAGDSRDYP